MRAIRYQKVQTNTNLTSNSVTFYVNILNRRIFYGIKQIIAQN